MLLWIIHGNTIESYTGLKIFHVGKPMMLCSKRIFLYLYMINEIRETYITDMYIEIPIISRDS